MLFELLVCLCCFYCSADVIDEPATSAEVLLQDIVLDGDVLVKKGESHHLTAGPYDATPIPSRKWPKVDGVTTLPYYIEPGAFNAVQVHAIETRLDDLQNAVKVNARDCVRFRQMLSPNDTQDFVHVIKGAGCSSLVGREGGAQPISMNDICFRRHATLQHAFAHALGFIHTHSRTDRDTHVKINEENIAPGNEESFRKYGSGEIDLLRTPYDYDSMMHYGPYEHAVDPQIQTINTIPNGDNSDRIGQRLGPSPGDVERIQRHHGCIL